MVLIDIYFVYNVVMLQIKKYLLGICLLTPITTGLLISCNKNSEDIPTSHYEMTISPEHSFGYSQYTMVPDAYVDYTVDIDGTIHDGDYVESVIIQQTFEGEVDKYISIDPDFLQINLSKDTKQINIRIRKNSQFDQKYFWANFSLKMNLMRNYETIYSITFNNLQFINGTPTTPDMFATHFDEEGIEILDGWSNEPWVEHYLQYCNILIIPESVEIITKQAFFNPNNSTSLIPNNIQVLASDPLLQISATYDKELTIQEEAFNYAPFNHIFLPQNLTEMGSQCFGNNYSLRIIDLTNFDAIPSWKGKDLFLNLSESGTVFYSMLTRELEWLNFFELTEGQDHPILEWNYINY